MAKLGRICIRIGIWFLVSLVVLISVALIALPQIAMYIAEDEYNKQSSEHSLDIGSFKVNVFTGSLILEEVQAHYGENINYIGRLEIDLGLWKLFSKTLYLEKITLDNIKLNIGYTKDSLSIAGYDIDLSQSEEQTLVESDSEPETEQKIEWNLKLGKFAITNTQVGANAIPLNSELYLNVETLSLGEFDTSSDFSVPFNAHLTVKNASYQEWVNVVEPLGLDLKGTFYWRNNQPDLEGEISAKNLFVQLPKKGSINLESLSMKGLKANQKQQRFDSLVFSGFDVVALDENNSDNLEPTVAFKTLSLSNVKHVNGNINLAKLQLDGLHLAPAEYPEIKQNPLPVADIQTIVASDFSFKAKKAVLNTLDISELKVASKQADMLRLKHYVANNTSYLDNRLELGKHHFEGLEAWLKRDKNGDIAGLPKPQEPDSEKKDANDSPKTKEASEAQKEQQEHKAVDEEESQKEQEKAPETPFSLAMTEFKQTSDSFIYFIDESVNPKVKKDIRIETLQIKNLDTANKSQPVVFEMLAYLDKFNSVSLKGDLALKEKMDGNILFNIDQLDLPPLSAYVRQGIGYNVNHGMLGLNLDSKIKQGTLAGKGKLTLANAEFDPADKKTIKRLSKQLSIPLDTALNLLSDGDKKVEVDFPIEGDVSNPSVGVTTILTQITQDVLVKATITYLKYFFNPFGAVIAAAEVGDNLLFSINLKPLKFPADSDSTQPMTLNSSHKRYLNKVVDMMKKQKSLQLKVCPFMLKREGWAKQATAIANEAKAYLSEKEKALSSRVFVCTPKVGKSNQLLLGF